MRAVVQRVNSASVRIGTDTVGRLDRPGLLVLVGATHSDTVEAARKLARDVWTLRIMADEKSARDLGAPVLVVSQFTLYADTARGRRPSWSAAAPGDVAEPLVAAVVGALRAEGAHVETGRFGAQMQVESVNDGPMTLLLEA